MLIESYSIKTMLHQLISSFSWETLCLRSSKLGHCYCYDPRVFVFKTNILYYFTVLQNCFLCFTSSYECMILFLLNGFQRFFCSGYPGLRRAFHLQLTDVVGKDQLTLCFLALALVLFMLAIFCEEKKAFFLLRIAVEHIPDLLERIGFVF